MDHVKERIRLPEQVGILTDTFTVWKGTNHYKKDDIEANLVLEKETLSVLLKADKTPVREIFLVWENEVESSDEILADHWERSYGDLEWKRAEDTEVMPWYFLADCGQSCKAFGIKVRPGAMCWWELQKEKLVLHLDVRCGGKGVVLDGRTLTAAQVLMKEYETDAFEAASLFCRSMCTDAITPETPVYGSNNWYYAYGKSSREDILKDCQYLAAMTEKLQPRPFMVIDDGWQVSHSDNYNGGPWTDGNSGYGDMKQLADDMKQYDVRPGIWFRPLLDYSADIPEDWRLPREKAVLDVSVPAVISHIQEDFKRMKAWGFELVKHDFSTFDLFGRWGFMMGKELTDPEWCFHDRSRTTAEIIVAFYQAIKDAAEDMIILGCNCIGHLGAGLMHLNRIGDDTSGMEWERTRKMGINTLAFRMPQQGAFFGADADCVGITGEIPWEKNRQWMKLLAESGTPFFVSVKPGILTEVQEEELKQAYYDAASNMEQAIPLDWKKTKPPEKWKTFKGVQRFEW